MLETIRFVRGAVSDKDTGPHPILTHFFIYSGRVQGSDGRIAIDAACPDLNIDAIVPAERFLRAVDICGDKVRLKASEKADRVVVTDGRFKATLALFQADYPRKEPSKGKKYPVPDDFIEELSLLRPFIGEDATRPWSSSIYFHKGSSFAIYNAIMGVMEKSVLQGHELALPIHCVDELLRIGVAPDKFSYDETSVTFFWGATRWLQSQLLVNEWPSATAEKLLAEVPKKMPTIPDGFLEAVEKVVPFCNDPDYPIVDFNSTGISTQDSAESKAEISGIDLKTFRSDARNLVPMLKVADSMFINDDGSKAYFRNKKLGWVGLLAGIKRV
jgi:hypothetical protein